jgi:sn-glycerol 3-phosphate transport system permease protein
MMLNSFIMAFGITVGKITVSMLSAFAIVWFRFPLRNLFFWMIFITLMLPVEVRIFPTVEVIANLKMLDSYAGLNAAADGLGDRHLPVPPVLYDPAGRAD